MNNLNELNIPQRIDQVLNIISGMTLTGYQQFNAAAQAIQQLAGISQDVQKLLAAQESEAQDEEHQAE